MNEGTSKNDGDKIAEIDAIKIQYNKLAEDWRQFDTILWGIPTVAVFNYGGHYCRCISAGIIRLAEHFVSLVIGSLFLFGLTIEVMKKRVHMNAISDILKEYKKKAVLD